MTIILAGRAVAFVNKILGEHHVLRLLDLRPRIGVSSGGIVHGIAFPDSYLYGKIGRRVYLQVLRTRVEWRAAFVMQ